MSPTKSTHPSPTHRWNTRDTKSDMVRGARNGQQAEQRGTRWGRAVGSPSEPRQGAWEWSAGVSPSVLPAALGGGSPASAALGQGGTWGLLRKPCAGGSAHGSRVPATRLGLGGQMHTRKAGGQASGGSQLGGDTDCPPLFTARCGLSEEEGVPLAQRTEVLSWGT